MRWCTYTGRAGGSEYWWFVLFGTIMFGLACLFDHAAFGRHSLFWTTCTLVFLMPYIAVAIRRLHDTDRSGWWQLIVLLPLLGCIAMLFFLAQEGKPTTRF